MLNSLPYEAPARGKAWLQVVTAQLRKGREALVMARWIVKDVMEAGVGEQAFNGVAYAAGTVAAFVSGWAACQWMIRLVKRTNLNVFAVYCLAAGIASILFI